LIFKHLKYFLFRVIWDFCVLFLLLFLHWSHRISVSLSLRKIMTKNRLYQILSCVLLVGTGQYVKKAHWDINMWKSLPNIKVVQYHTSVVWNICLDFLNLGWPFWNRVNTVYSERSLWDSKGCTEGNWVAPSSLSLSSMDSSKVILLFNCSIPLPMTQSKITFEPSISSSTKETTVYTTLVM
jgi:hypothetical protein